MAVLYKHAIARADCSRETITTLAQKATAVRGMNLYAQMHWRIGAAKNIYLVWSRGITTEANGLGVPVVSPGNNMALKVQWDFF